MKLVTYVALCTPFMIAAAQEPLEENVLLAEGALANIAEAPAKTASEKPFKCPFCTVLGYTLNSSLVRHLRDSHGQEKIDPTIYRINKSPYACLMDGCDKAFSRKDRLEKHKEKDHSQSQEAPAQAESGKPFKCPFSPSAGCNVLGYSVHSSLVRHMADKHGQKELDATIDTIIERPYACLVDGGGRAFSRKDRLDQHTEKEHSQSEKVKQVFDCPVEGCFSKGFSSEPIRKRHIKEQHAQWVRPIAEDSTPTAPVKPVALRIANGEQPDWWVNFLREGAQ